MRSCTEPQAAVIMAVMLLGTIAAVTDGWWVKPAFYGMLLFIMIGFGLLLMMIFKSPKRPSHDLE